MIITIDFKDIVVYTLAVAFIGWGLGVYSCYRYKKKSEESSHEKRV